LVQKPTPKERWKKKSDHSRLVGGNFNKQRNTHARFVLGGNKLSRSPYSSARILRVYIEGITWVHSHIPQDGLNNISLSQGFILENDSHCGTSRENVNSNIDTDSDDNPGSLFQWPTEPAYLVQSVRMLLDKGIQKQVDILGFL
jgi:hypothetical protein